MPGQVGAASMYE